MKIALVDPSNFSGPYDEHLCHGLASLGHTVRLYTRAPRPSENWYSEEYERDFSFYKISERVFSGSARLRALAKGLEHALDVRAFSRSIERFDPDVVHFQWLPMPLLDGGVARRMSNRRRVVLTVHDTIAFQGSPTSRLQTVGLQKAFASFDRFIVHTRKSASELQLQGVPKEKIRTVPHGVLFARGPTDLVPLARSGYDPTNSDVLFFGNIKPYKGVDVLLRGYRAARESGQPIGKLIIAGKAPGNEVFWENEVAELGLSAGVDLRLRHIPDKDLSQLFSGVGILVFPYRQIDASGALMLALSYGRAIIATDVGLFSELFHHTENAYLVPPGDWSALGEAIATVSSDGALRRRLAAGSLSLASTTLDWSNIAKETIAVYDGISR